MNMRTRQLALTAGFALAAMAPTASAYSPNPAISADGRYVAFASSARDLSGEDDDSATDIFVRDLQTNGVTLVSRATGASGAGGDRNSESPSISADGRYVAFASRAANLSAEDGDQGEGAFGTDVFVRDLQAQTTTLVSRAGGASGPAGDNFSLDPSISADGRYVAFESVADNLSAEDNDFANIFVRDLQANTTTLASRATGAAGEAANGGSVRASVSADGHSVAFESVATNLGADVATVDIFVRDLQANTTTLVSRATGPSGPAGDSYSTAPSISADGRYVAFESAAQNLATGTSPYIGHAFVRDVQANVTSLVSRATGASGPLADRGARAPEISDDGSLVAYASGADNLSAEDRDVVGVDCYMVPHQWICEDVRVADVFLRDLQSSATVFTSRQSGAEGAALPGSSDEPSISADGRHLAFSSCRTSDDTSDAIDIYVRDLESGGLAWVGDEPDPGVGGSLLCSGLRVDATSPVTSITRRPENKILAEDEKVKVKFAFTSTEFGYLTGFKCRRDKRRWKKCDSPMAYRAKPGKHRFRVRAFDAAGNIDETPAKDRFKVVR